ncbi:GNAT family N-acetyltransferase [Macrococcus equipercicus]|uniref:GNAT family N-acetyltransferase n=1 Tax=Macrococcus equipercicus TaxID=69967 RepID=A0A9Q9BKW9_9STAP|nr:GNAT family N-acetyltransferase [Macrococcus equipercicus]KAA1036594.1 GNAT family N-acetyltransferase [Macrococcus equipercicus]UTH13473.1 GNAT family N-acetyltransferase [Macrococcus equipercicus]
MIITKRLTIRPLDKQLIDDMTADEPVQERFLNHVEKLSIDPTLTGWDVWIVQLKDGTYIGDIGFKGKPDESLEIEVGYSFLQDYHGQGYATESVSALLADVYARNAALTVKAECFKDNPASQRVLEKLAFNVTSESSDIIYWEKKLTSY